MIKLINRAILNKNTVNKHIIKKCTAGNYKLKIFSMMIMQIIELLNKDINK